MERWLEDLKYRNINWLLNCWFTRKSFPVWRRFATSWFYLKYLTKQSNLHTCTTLHKKWSDFIKNHCPCWKDEIWIIHCLIVNIVFVLNPFEFYLLYHSILFNWSSHFRDDFRQCHCAKNASKTQLALWNNSPVPIRCNKIVHGP